MLLHAERALALLDGLETRDGATPEHAALRWRVLLAREKTNNLQGRRPEQRRDLQALDALAQAAGDDRRRAGVAVRCANLARIEADWVASEHHSRDAMRWAGAAGDDAQRLQAQVSLAIALRGAGSSTRRRGLPRPVWPKRASAASSPSRGATCARWR